MRKAITKERITNAPVLESQHPFVNDLLPFCSPDLARYQRLQSMYNQNIQEAKRRAHLAMAKWSESYKESKKLVSPPVNAEDVENAQRLAQQLMNHAFVEKVTIDSGLLTIFTRLLFSDIRRGDGLREKARRCIGAFQIEMPIEGSGKIKVQNLLYTKARYPHWAVKRQDGACLGEYYDDVWMKVNDKQLYELVDTMIDFLRSSGDEAAYILAHHWINDRIAYLPQLSTAGKVRRGAMIVLQTDCQTCTRH